MKTVFISYAHQDNDSADADCRWLDRLCLHLGPLAAQGLLAMWSDKEIAMGDLWQSAISKQLTTAKVAVLLISPAFLASSYIREYEMPALLPRALRGDLKVIPVIVRHCLFSTTEFDIPDVQNRRRLVSLAEFQASNPVHRPLNSLDQAEQDKTLVAVAQRVSEILHPYASPSPARVTEAQPRSATARDPFKNRIRLIKRVERDWIEGVLNQTLYAAAPLNLGLSNQSEAVQKAWDLVVHQTGIEPQIHNTGEIATIFEDFDRQLLILGEPGTGKTVTLLTLARHLLHRAADDPSLPVPVVLTLSTWAQRREALGIWLTDELNKRYEIPRQLAGRWVANGSILPFLDGLDEVPEHSRELCVSAINRFREDQESMVVCSRAKDYAQLSARLRLCGALTIQPLTRNQVDRHLAEFGQPLSPVREALANDETLYELFDTPLMLSVASVAFADGSPVELSRIGGLEERRTSLLGKYVDSVFTRPGRAKPDPRRSYSKEQTVSWLVWLASVMERNHQPVLYLGWMQPSFLAPVRERAEFRAFTALALGIVVACVLFFPLSLWMFVSESERAYQLAGTADVVAMLTVTLAAAVMLAAFHGLMAGLVSFMTHPLQGAVVAVVVVFLCDWKFQFAFMRELWAMWLVLGLAAIVSWFGTQVFRNARSITPVERLSWSWLALRKALRQRTIEGGIVGLALGVFAVWRDHLLWASTGRALNTALAAAFAGVLAAFGVALGVGIALLFGGFARSTVAIRTVPNSETKRSGWLGGGCVLLALVPSLIALFEYVSGHAFTSHMWVTNRAGISLGAYAWAMCGIVAAGHFGGYAFLQHYALRWVLWRRRHAPAHYVRFLDWAVELILMRRAGGGYFFIHRMLLEYLASLHQPAARK